MSVRAVTELLAAVASDDASARSIASIVAEQRVSAPESARLEELAGQLRSSFGRWRRREQELSAILSGVRELAGLRDVDELLTRLVDRARNLMLADVAYLTQHHDGQLQVRNTSGVVAPELRSLVVPAGMGLASRIVNLRTPQWTSAYDATSNIPHEEGIDDAVSAEGLVGLLGVPLLAGGEVLGALFAGYRSRHEFTPDEAALLGAFADHAAVILQTARLLENAEAQAVEARRARDGLMANLAAMERASGVHEDLTSVVVRGGSAEGVAATLSGALGRRVVILDRDLSPVADSPGTDARTRVPEAGRLSRSVTNAVARSRSSGLCVQVDDPDDEYDVVVAVVSDDAVLGALLLGGGGLELGEVERRTVERAAQIMALVTLKQDAVVDAENRVSDELVSEILDPRTSDRTGLAAGARSRGIRLHELRSVVVVSVAAERRRRALSVLRQMDTTVLAAESDGRLIVLSAEEDGLALAGETRRRLVPVAGEQVLAVAGPPARGAEDLPRAFEAARRCVGLLADLGTSAGAVDARAYAPYLAMFGAGDGVIADYIDAVIGPVVRWDDQRDADLLRTLEAFLDSNSSPTRTARVLHVHVNTVLQRLARLAALLGEDWREPEPLFRTWVAVRLQAARQT